MRNPPSLHFVAFLFLAIVFDIKGCSAIPSPAGPGDDTDRATSNSEPASVAYLTTDMHPAHSSPEVARRQTIQDISTDPSPTRGRLGTQMHGQSPDELLRRLRGEEPEVLGEGNGAARKLNFQFHWDVENFAVHGNDGGDDDDDDDDNRYYLPEDFPLRDEALDDSSSDMDLDDSSSEEQGSSGDYRRFGGHWALRNPGFFHQISVATGEPLTDHPPSRPPDNPVRPPQREWFHVPRQEDAPRNLPTRAAVRESWTNIQRLLGDLQYSSSGNTYWRLGSQNHVRIGWWREARTQDWDLRTVPTSPMNTLVIAPMGADSSTLARQPVALVSWLKQRLESGDANAMGGYLYLRTVMYGRLRVFAFDYQVLDNDSMWVPVTPELPALRKDPPASGSSPDRKRTKLEARDDEDSVDNTDKSAKIFFVGWNTIGNPVFEPIKAVTTKRLVPRKDGRPIYVPMPEVDGLDVLKSELSIVAIVFTLILKLSL
ncbi:MAG: hypothetical protein M1831_005502 [Alyxoria varia]|nr:MAG: hypothetical protein M1831_005502 [Alyxoria varia]